MVSLGLSTSPITTCDPNSSNYNGQPLVIPLSRSSEAPTPFLQTLTYLLDRDHEKTPSNPLLSTILLSISDHLNDADTAKLIGAMSDRGDLYPINLEWIANWERILNNLTLFMPSRPLTRSVVLGALQSVAIFVKDVPRHRHPFVDLVLSSWRRLKVDSGVMEGSVIVWNLLADEVVLRTTEGDEQSMEDGLAPGTPFVDQALEIMINCALGSDVGEDNGPTMMDFSAHVPTPLASAISPSINHNLSNQFEVVTTHRERDSNPPYSNLTFTSGTIRTATQPPQLSTEDTPSPAMISPPTLELTAPPGSVGAVVALLHVFSQLSFTPYALKEANRELAVRVFRILIDLISKSKSPHARLAVLQFFFRLRVDRDHRLFSLFTRYDRLGHIMALAGLIGRADIPPHIGGDGDDITGDDPSDIQELLKSRARATERGGRRWSRGRDTMPSHSGSSRSRSRAAGGIKLPAGGLPEKKTKAPIWRVPESLPFSIPESDTPSDGLVSYDPEGPGNRVVLPVSCFLKAIISIVKSERDWDILSYVLCHLPTLLANKHLFCGPKSRVEIQDLLAVICDGISSETFASSIALWPPGLKARDAEGLAYHTLSVLISYRKCFGPPLQHVLVEVLLRGLSGQQSTIKCCLHALSLSAFELPNSIRRFLTQILEKLSQIRTNATIAVHIISFLAIVGSLPPLYSNFIEGDFRLVFGVALQYLRLHNRPEASADTSWALSQHVRIMSYYILYLWFLAVRLPDRPRHIKYITRQLLLANEGRDEIDGSAEVCFDWLARYTYGSGDPRPANSMLSEVVMTSDIQRPASEVISEKTWVVGNSLVSIRALAKNGWLEVVARRPSGLTKILARIENVPMVGPGEVDPDLISIPAILAMSRALTSGDDPVYQVS